LVIKNQKKLRPFENTLSLLGEIALAKAISPKITTHFSVHISAVVESVRSFSAVFIGQPTNYLYQVSWMTLANSHFRTAIHVSKCFMTLFLHNTL